MQKKEPRICLGKYGTSYFIHIKIYSPPKSARFARSPRSRQEAGRGIFEIRLPSRGRAPNEAQRVPHRNGQARGIPPITQRDFCSSPKILQAPRVCPRARRVLLILRQDRSDAPCSRERSARSRKSPQVAQEREQGRPKIPS